MSVTAVSAVYSYSQDPLRQENGLRQDLLTLQQALSLGNVTGAQQALSHFQQDLQSIQPQQNGIRASAEVNPASTMRADLQALQSALDSGDLAMAEEAFVRVQQDSQRITGPGAGLRGQPEGEHSGYDAAGLPAAQSKTNGNLVDLSA